MTQESVLTELDHRENDGISVTLWWITPEDTLMVSVHDNKTHEDFTLNDIPRDKAREYFIHPYAERMPQS
jgi:hypothetical protein